MSRNEQAVEETFHIALVIGIQPGKSLILYAIHLKRTHRHVLNKGFQLSKHRLLADATACSYVLGLHQRTTLAHNRSKTHGIVQSVSALQHSSINVGSLRVAHVTQEAVCHKAVFRLQAFEFLLAFGNSQVCHTLAQHAQGTRHITLHKNCVVDS